MLYILADKFLEGKDLNEIKEVVAMTRIGQMLLDEGMERGIQKGLARGLSEGKIAGEAQMAALSRKLLDENRLDDLRRASEDEKFRKELMKELDNH